MTREEIEIARDEAKRFLDRVPAALDAHVWRDSKAFKHGGYWDNTDTKASAALKRASMDLTRSLVAIRKA